MRGVDNLDVERLQRNGGVAIGSCGTGKGVGALGTGLVAIALYAVHVGARLARR